MFVYCGECFKKTTSEFTGENHIDQPGVLFSDHVALECLNLVILMGGQERTNYKSEIHRRTCKLIS